MGDDLIVRAGRLVDGRVVDVVVADGRVATLAQVGKAGTGARVLDADGRLVTPSFVNAHMHLDKVYTLPLLGDRAIEAYTGEGMAGAMTAIEIAREIKLGYQRDALLPNVRRALREAVRYGALHVEAFVDVDTAARLEGLHAVLAAREEFRDVLDVRVVAFPQDGLLRDPGAAELCEQALDQGADIVGGIPWIEHTEAEARQHVEWACGLAARTGRRVAMLVDDAGDPSLRTTEMLAEAMLRHELVGRGVACHARAIALYPEPAILRLMAHAARSGLCFVSDPHTGPLALPVDRFEGAGLSTALGQDDIEDAYYPYGRHNMLEVAFLASHLLDMRSSSDQARLLDMVTTQAARVLGLPRHAVEPGATANLCIHDAERIVDLVREHAAPRWVLSHGRVVAESVTTTTFHPAVPRQA
ncbi:MAG: amidohydrolase family protein [Jiangellaceae bacterium]